MRILIKGMTMPKSCDMCWALDDYGDYPRCRVTEEQRGYNFPVREKRMDNCPLIPAADVVERKTGKWIYEPTEPLGYKCSICEKGSCRFNYCPNCGADMRGEAE